MFKKQPKHVTTSFIKTKNIYINPLLSSESEDNNDINRLTSPNSFNNSEIIKASLRDRRVSLINDYSIWPTKKVNILTERSKSESHQDQEYYYIEVNKDDTLVQLAVSCNCTVSELKQLNKLTSDFTYPGQILLVKNSNHDSNKSMKTLSDRKIKKHEKNNKNIYLHNFEKRLRQGPQSMRFGKLNVIGSSSFVDSNDDETYSEIVEENNVFQIIQKKTIDENSAKNNKMNSIELQDYICNPSEDNRLRNNFDDNKLFDNSLSGNETNNEKETYSHSKASQQDVNNLINEIVRKVSTSCIWDVNINLEKKGKNKLIENVLDIETVKERNKIMVNNEKCSRFCIESSNIGDEIIRKVSDVSYSNCNSNNSNSNIFKEEKLNSKKKKLKKEDKYVNKYLNENEMSLLTFDKKDSFKIIPDIKSGNTISIINTSELTKDCMTSVCKENISKNEAEKISPQENIGPTKLDSHFNKSNYSTNKGNNLLKLNPYAKQRRTGISNFLKLPELPNNLNDCVRMKNINIKYNLIMPNVEIACDFSNNIKIENTNIEQNKHLIETDSISEEPDYNSQKSQYKMKRRALSVFTMPEIHILHEKENEKKKTSSPINKSFSSKENVHIKKRNIFENSETIYHDMEGLEKPINHSNSLINQERNKQSKLRSVSSIILPNFQRLYSPVRHKKRSHASIDNKGNTSEINLSLNKEIKTSREIENKSRIRKLSSKFLNLFSDSKQLLTVHHERRFKQNSQIKTMVFDVTLLIPSEENNNETNSEIETKYGKMSVDYDNITFESSFSKSSTDYHYFKINCDFIMKITFYSYIVLSSSSSEKMKSLTDLKLNLMDFKILKNSSSNLNKCDVENYLNYKNNSITNKDTSLNVITIKEIEAQIEDITLIDNQKINSIEGIDSSIEFQNKKTSSTENCLMKNEEFFNKNIEFNENCLNLNIGEKNEEYLISFSGHFPENIPYFDEEKQCTSKMWMKIDKIKLSQWVEQLSNIFKMSYFSASSNLEYTDENRLNHYEDENENFYSLSINIIQDSNFLSNNKEGLCISKIKLKKGKNLRLQPFFIGETIYCNWNESLEIDQLSIDTEFELTVVFGESSKLKYFKKCGYFQINHLKLNKDSKIWLDLEDNKDRLNHNNYARHGKIQINLYLFMKSSSGCALLYTDYPILQQGSDILNNYHSMMLFDHLPISASFKLSWLNKFSTSQNGCSLKTMYRCCADADDEAYFLFIIKDTEARIFGAFITGKPKICDNFYGNGECFLFSFYPEFQKYSWSGLNTFFAMGNHDSISFGSGSGHFGLWLDQELDRGSTEICETYQNLPLIPERDFKAAIVELWLLTN